MRASSKGAISPLLWFSMSYLGGRTGSPLIQVDTPSMVASFSPDATLCEGLVSHFAALPMKLAIGLAFTSVYAAGNRLGPHPGPKLVIPIWVYLALDA